MIEVQVEHHEAVQKVIKGVRLDEERRFRVSNSSSVRTLAMD